MFDCLNGGPDVLLEARTSPGLLEYLRFRNSAQRPQKQRGGDQSSNPLRPLTLRSIQWFRDVLHTPSPPKHRSVFMPFLIDALDRLGEAVREADDDGRADQISHVEWRCS